MIFTILATTIVFLNFDISVYALGNEVEPIVEIDKSATELQSIVDKQWNTDLSEFPFYQNAMNYLNKLTSNDFYGCNYFCFSPTINAETNENWSCFVFHDEDISLLSLYYIESYNRFTYLPQNFISQIQFSFVTGNSSGAKNVSYNAPGSSYSYSYSNSYNLTSDSYYFTNLDTISIVGNDSMQTLKTSDGTLFNSSDVFLNKSETGIWQINTSNTSDSSFSSFIFYVSSVIYGRVGYLSNFIINHSILLLPISALLLSLILCLILRWFYD